MGTFHARYAWLGGDSLAGDVTIVVEDGTISGIAPGTPAPDAATELAGITIPGLVDAHSHAFHRALRFRTHRPGGNFWLWRDAMYRIADRLDPESLEELATAVFAEVALAGATSVGEFHYVHHGPGGTRYDDPNAMSHALAGAARSVGVRLVLLDTCFLRGGFDGPLEGTQLRFGDRDVASWAERVDALRKAYEGDPLVSIGVAAHSVRAVAPGDIAEIAAYAADRGMPFHVHLSEQPAENAEAVAATGLTPSGILAAAGALGAGTSVVHATHLTVGDLDLLGGAGATAVLCPTTERDLGDGLGPATELAAAGSTLAVGSDQHAVTDLFEEARAIELHDRLRLGRMGIHSPPSLLTAATAGGAGALGLPASGIALGGPADFVTVRSDAPSMAGLPDDDPIAGIVFGASPADVADVVVGGERIVAAGEHRSIGDVAGRLDLAIRRLVESP